MDTDKMLDSFFNYGDTVFVMENSPAYYKPGFLGSICGVRTLSSPDNAKQFHKIKGSELYLIEFSTGETIEIPKKYLMLKNKS